MFLVLHRQGGSSSEPDSYEVAHLPNPCVISVSHRSSLGRVSWFSEAAVGSCPPERRGKKSTPGAVREARRNLRRAIRRAKKACWNEFLENASGDDIWKAARYTAPRPDDSQRPLVNGTTTAITREEKEAMVIQVAFPEPPTGNGI